MKKLFIPVVSFFNILVLCSIVTKITLAQSNNYETQYFNNSFTGGQLIINSTTYNVPTSGYVEYTIYTNNTLSTATAINNQNASGDIWIFNSWLLDGNYETSNITTSVKYQTGYPTVSGFFHTAYFKKICHVTFQNNFINVSNGNVITVNNIQYNSPTSSFTVMPNSSITATAINYWSFNGISYYFSSWSNGSTNNTTTFYPTDHITYTANFIGKPTNTTRNLTFGTAIRRPITFTWTDNPNPNVTQYQIWRCIISQGITSNLVQIGTVARGVHSFTDDDYILTSNNQSGVNYDARPYYSIEGTTADPDWQYVPAQIQAKESAKNDSKSINGDEVENYALEQNSPNPFNPSTIISYQVPNAGFVSLKVYDILGREVSTLVNEVKAQGKYSVRFNAANLTSGVYIYQLKANGFSSIKKMILTK